MNAPPSLQALTQLQLFHRRPSGLGFSCLPPLPHSHSACRPLPCLESIALALRATDLLGFKLKALPGPAASARGSFFPGKTKPWPHPTPALCHGRQPRCRKGSVESEVPRQADGTRGFGGQGATGLAPPPGSRGGPAFLVPRPRLRGETRHGGHAGGPLPEVAGVTPGPLQAWLGLPAFSKGGWPTSRTWHLGQAPSKGTSSRG